MANGDTIDRVVIHMYKMGTGDCFVLKFMKRNDVSFKMLIDCGVWSGAKADIQKFVKTLKADVDDHVDVLVVTHEHKDHVYGFEAADDLFTDGQFQADQIWMAWTEDDGSRKVKRWKKDYAQQKKALALAADTLHDVVRSNDFKMQFGKSRHHDQLLAMRTNFSAVLEEFADLHVERKFGVNKVYVGGMEGMRIAKVDLQVTPEYLFPGDIKEGIDGLEGVRVFVLGPPKSIFAVKTEHGEEGESFEHNKEIDDDQLLLDALGTLGDSYVPSTTAPFDDSYVTDDASFFKDEPWRRIDYDWLFSSGQFALRMNSLTNNLSLVLAFEFANGKVMLFPGDAEFGSWESWHKIDWEALGERAFGTNEPLTTESLLNRTVFYKVAHHLSHNGTAKSLGLDMMTDPSLVAMATLDYNVISNGWKSTMPNRLIVKQLLEQTQGRLIIMNEHDLFYDTNDAVPLTGVIQEYRDKMPNKNKFFAALDTSNPHYTEYVLDIG